VGGGSPVDQVHGGSQNTRNGPASVDLSFHLVDARNGSVISNLVDRVGGNWIASRGRVAGSAFVEGSAVLVDGLVVVAGFVGNSVRVGVSVNRAIVSSVAVSSVGTINHVLN